MTGPALAPRTQELPPQFEREADRPLDIRYCARGQGHLELLFSSKQSKKVVLNLLVESDTGRPISVTFYDSDQRPTLASSFHRNGAPHELSVRSAYVLKHTVGFRDDASLEFTSKIENARRGYAQEVRQYFQYFEADGSQGESRAIRHHCAD